jgi:hypothetical protein
MSSAPAFDLDAGLERLSHAELVRVGREYMLFAHMLDRALMPQVAMRWGGDAMKEIAIEEWMGSSPIYTERIRRALRIGGADVVAIFKALQLDPGFAHQYMDVGYEVESPSRGYFWLNHCGALLDVEPLGEGAVVNMCHHIEDPTFDATIGSVAPHGRCRPVHRPPRVPADRVPVCRWVVSIDADTPPWQEAEITGRVRASKLAQRPPAECRDLGGPGLPDYAGAFVPAFDLALLARGALLAECRELLRAAHLVVRAGLTAIAARHGAEPAQELGLGQWRGVAPATTARLARALGVEGGGAAALLRVLEIHPAFVPGYARLGAELLAPDRARIWLEDCDALAEAEPFGWLPLLAEGRLDGLEATLQALDPHARVSAVRGGRGVAAFDVVLDPSAEPAKPPREAAFVRASTVSRFDFRDARA